MMSFTAKSQRREGRAQSRGKWKKILASLFAPLRLRGKIKITTILLLSLTSLHAQDTYVRTNLLGYFPDDAKSALILSKEKLKGPFMVINTKSGKVPFSTKPQKAKGNFWGDFEHQYTFDFSDLKKPGTYFIQAKEGRSEVFSVGEKTFKNVQGDLLYFMRQQRCGYNPYFDVVCHHRDGRSFFAPVPDSTYFDLSGGWHDAGDQLKYLITSSNATARMLTAWLLAPENFKDSVDALGHPHPNFIPDVLDEAKWGLDWILKMHPKSDWLFHQIADDRDHRGFKMPDEDNADYGWGPNSYRAAYFATGKPQGLGKWKSESTGIANLAGRSAAAMAMASRIWMEESMDPSFAKKCFIAAVDLYHLGKQNEGYQQGNSYGAPYRYNEDSWADDMEWAAAELYKCTGDKEYLEDAIRYANIIKEDGWMARDSINHYQKYPFMNMGHFSLYEVVGDSMKTQLAQWYQANIEKVKARAQTNAFQIGIPFIWCSNNLVVNFITQVLLYEKMTGDFQYHSLMLVHRDWLLGRNPWGTSMFTGIPSNGETPLDVHLACRHILKQTPRGGLVDGPVYRSIYDKLLGIKLNEPDELAAFQNEFVTYHDDIGDYATNEPTMDGTADAVLMVALLCGGRNTD